MLKQLLLATALTASLALTAYAEDTPRNGGTIRYTAPYGANFTSLDIHAASRAQDEVFAKAIHRTLYKWNSFANKPELELATSVSVSADGLVYTYKLRDDAYFHNGRKMTADDVIWSYNRIMDGSKGYPGARYVGLIKGALEVQKGEAKEISGLKKIDDFTLEITFKDRGDPGYGLHFSTTAIYPREEAVKPEFASKPIGLGPYKFVEYIPGSRFVAERWEKFYKPGLPHADKLVVSLMAEAAARDVAFRNHEVDATILGPQQYVAYKQDAALSKGLMEVPEFFTRVMGMNPSFKPFSDKRVRQAINYAIDTDLIIKRLVRDKAYRATSWLPLNSPAYDPSLKPYPYDPEKAKKLLVEAGYADGFEFEWTATSNESWGMPIAEAVIPMLAKVGIRVKMKAVDGAVLAEAAGKGDYQAFLWSLGTGPDPLTALKSFHSSLAQSAGNYMAYKNPAVDALLEEAASTSDNDKRIAALKKANAIIFDDAPVWFFNYNKAVMAVQPWLHGVQPDGVDLAIQYYEDMWVDASSPAAK